MHIQDGLSKIHCEYRNEAGVGDEVQEGRACKAVRVGTLKATGLWDLLEVRPVAVLTEHYYSLMHEKDSPSIRGTAWDGD